eukprot:1804011-Amphidinium_carterae.1
MVSAQRAHREFTVDKRTSSDRRCKSKTGEKRNTTQNITQPYAPSKTNQHVMKQRQTLQNTNTHKPDTQLAYVI